MTEESEECDEMFSETDDGEWDISDEDDDDLRSASAKDQDKVTANMKEMKSFQLSLLLYFVDFRPVMVVAGESVHPASYMNCSLFGNTFQYKLVLFKNQSINL